MGLGFFVQQVAGRRYIYHDGDQGGFSAELLFDPAARKGAVLIVNTTDTGAPPAADPSRPQTNTEPDPTSDLRVALRETLLKSVFTAPQAKH
jgi:hypothetical protein